MSNKSFGRGKLHFGERTVTPGSPLALQEQLAQRNKDKFYNSPKLRTSPRLNISGGTGTGNLLGAWTTEKYKKRLKARITLSKI